MNAKAKGSRNEHQSRAILEAAGYRVTCAAGSLGQWDLVGLSATDLVLVQVKTRDWPGTTEWQVLAEFPAPPNALRHQVGDDELRVLFPVGQLAQVARGLRARRRVVTEVRRQTLVEARSRVTAARQDRIRRRGAGEGSDGPVTHHRCPSQRGAPQR